MNLHVYFHSLALDGVYVPGDTPEAPPRFMRAPEPTSEQLRWLCTRVVERAVRLVARRPLREPVDERQTQVFKVHGAEPREPVHKRLHARVEGFDLHASAPMEAHERVAVERFCRYALRRPIANGRLSKGPRGRLPPHRLGKPAAARLHVRGAGLRLRQHRRVIATIEEGPASRKILRHPACPS